MRYSSFISYSFADRRFVKNLHIWLENYRIPKRLRGTQGALGPIGPRLPPVFRDRDELSAVADLGQAVRDALDQSASLIVVCTPASARSRWVNEEIRHFIASGRRDRIQCLIVAGEPHAADPAFECLPPALLEGGHGEPLAADARAGQDGLASARLKVLAGVLGIAYDELRQREQQRRVQRLAWLATGSTAGLVVAIGLTIAALLARAEAVRQRNIAVERTRTAERTTQFVKSLFEVSDPSNARGASMTAREIVDRGAVQVRQQLGEEPAVRADLAVTVAQVYQTLGLYHEAADLLGWSMALPHHQVDVAARQMLALGDVKRNMGDNDGAIRAYSRGIALARSQPLLSDEVMPLLLGGQGEALTAKGDTRAAAAAIDQALQIDRARDGENSASVARDYEELGQNDYAARDLKAAEPLLRRALALRQKLEGPFSPSVSDDIVTLGALAYARGDLSTAERLERSRLAIDERVLGPDHPDVATTLNNLARILIEHRNFSGALPLLDRAVRINVKERGWTHPDMAFFLDNRAIAERALGQTRAAGADFQRGWAAADHNGHRNRAPILTDFALLKCQTGAVNEGLAMLDRARPLMAQTYPDEPWRMAWVDTVRAACLVQSGRYEAAAKLAGSAAPAITARWPKGTLYRSDYDQIAAAVRR